MYATCSDYVVGLFFGGVDSCRDVPQYKVMKYHVFGIISSSLLSELHVMIPDVDHDNLTCQRILGEVPTRMAVAVIFRPVFSTECVLYRMCSPRNVFLPRFCGQKNKKIVSQLPNEKSRFAPKKSFYHSTNISNNATNVDIPFTDFRAIFPGQVPRFGLGSVLSKFLKKTVLSEFRAILLSQRT